VRGDLDFDHGGEKTTPASGADGLQWILRGVLCLSLAAGFGILILVSFYVLKPFRFAERLSHPVTVVTVTPQALVLVDGTHLRLPFIKRIPHNDPTLRWILEQGVERDARGQVYCLLTVRPNCGMTVYRDYTYKVNLSDVVGALDPSALDESLLLPDEVAQIRTYVKRPSGTRMISSDFLLFSVRHVRQIREWREANPLVERPERSS